MGGVSRNNHFVPQGYLKRWEHGSGKIWTYHLLVSHASVPVWSARPIKGVAFRRDLYTSMSGSQESDDFERWIESEFETPGLTAIERATAGAQLTKKDWHALALYFAAQDLRTPLSYIESARRWKNELPEIMQSSLESVVQFLEAGGDKDAVPDDPSGGRAPDWFKEAFRVTVVPDADPENNMGALQIEAVAGRSLWLGQQRHLLEGVANQLAQHKWGIGEAATGHEWFTSDHPALKVNYTSPDSYDFGGGWGRPKGNLLLPLSPRHILFCQIGDPVDDRFAFSGKDTRLLQRLIAERAHRLIFARLRTPSIPKLRVRHDDAAAFEGEEAEWEKWHESQVTAENWDE